MANPHAVTEAAVEPGWAHALTSRASCQLGRCAFVDPTGPRNSHFAGTGCDGYHASRHDEPDGRVTIRWGLCPRHREWWRLERIRRGAQRAERGKP